jgi:hypothetical protein
VLPVIAYKVLLLVPWFDVQKGLVPVRDSPQGFTNRGSVMLARPGTLETRFVCAYCALTGRGRATVATATAASTPGRVHKAPSEDKIGFTFASSFANGRDGIDASHGHVIPPARE